LAESQSMGKLLYAFKIVLNMEKVHEENAHAPDGTQPYSLERSWCTLFRFHQLRMPPRE
jgi:hypothetical protein